MYFAPFSYQDILLRYILTQLVEILWPTCIEMYRWTEAQKTKKPWGCSLKWTLCNSKEELFLPPKCFFQGFSFLKFSLMTSPSLSTIMKGTIWSHASPVFNFLYRRTHIFNFVLECVGMLTKSIQTGTLGAASHSTEEFPQGGKGLHPKGLEMTCWFSW